MKKIVLILMICVFMLSACKNVENGISAGTQSSMQGSQIAQNPNNGDTNTDADFTNAKIVVDGYYDGFDRFSGAYIESVYIQVYDSNPSQFVFSYHSAAGKDFDSLTVSLDSSLRGSVDVSDTITLQVWIENGNVCIDELESLGALAYVFKPRN